MIEKPLLWDFNLYTQYEVAARNGEDGMTERRLYLLTTSC